MKVTIEVNEKQAYTIVKALDFFSRIHMGQFEEILYILGLPAHNDIARKLLAQLKLELFPELDMNAYYGIAQGEKVGEEAQISYEILTHIRHAIAWHKHPEGGIYVDFDDPMMLTDLPKPKVTVEDSGR